MPDTKSDCCGAHIYSYVNGVKGTLRLEPRGGGDMLLSIEGREVLLSSAHVLLLMGYLQDAFKFERAG